jgi:anaphase-promoting complex subunit 10
MTVQFPRKIAIQVRHCSIRIFTDANPFGQKISLLLRFPLDDSYTPSTLCIRAGTGLNDLQDVKIVTLDKPDGWITFDVSAEISEEGDA